MYSPEEDSFFFAEFLQSYLKKQKNKDLEYLDMGTGSGILSETAFKFLPKYNILAVDIDPQSMAHVSKKFQSIQSDLFSKIKDKKFDLITFNAPYLPEHKFDKQSDTTGGKNGDEISIKFLKQAFNHLNPCGKIFLLISSFTPLEKIKKFQPKIVARKKLFFEELFIFEFS